MTLEENIWEEDMTEELWQELEAGNASKYDNISSYTSRIKKNKTKWEAYMKEYSQHHFSVEKKGNKFKVNQQ